MKQLVLIILLLCAAIAGATTVTGQVLDPNGNAYAGGTFVIDFANGTGCGLPLLSGSPFQTQFTGSLDSGGNLPSLALADNNVVCVGSQWKFSICNSGRTACFSTAITITGSSQNIGATLKAAATTLPGFVLPSKQGFTASTTANASFNVPQGVAPTTPQDGDFWYDSTQKTDEVFLNGQQIAFDGPISVQTSNTAQATANNTSDQNLLANTVGTASLFPFNVVNKTWNVQAFGTYSLGAASTVNLKAKLCTVSGCGSGTVVNLASWTTASQTNTGVTLAWNINLQCATVTTGATGTAECHGTLNFDSGATLAAAASTFNDSNTAAVTGIPLNGQLFLQTTLAYGTANASNTALAREQVVTIGN